MAFLTKKELSLIRLINVNSKLTPEVKAKHISQINYNAKLRQDGYRLPVREFVQAMANHGVETVFNTIKQL